MKFPKDIQDIKQLRGSLSKIVQNDWNTIFIFFSTFFILYDLIYQMIFSENKPFQFQVISTILCKITKGSAIFNVFAGDLFGVAFGFPLVCFLNSYGAACCYWLASTLGKGVIKKIFPEKMKKLEESVRFHLILTLDRGKW
jgi:hypothetical protein